MSINILGAIIAAIASFLLGFAWYSNFLFGKRWRAEMGISQEETSKKGMKKQIIGGFMGELIIALIFGFMITLVGVVGYGQAMLLGFWLWLGFMFPILLGSTLWEGKKPALFGINALYRLVSMLLIGLILILI